MRLSAKKVRKQTTTKPNDANKNISSAAVPARVLATRRSRMPTSVIASPARVPLVARSAIKIPCKSLGP
jgi:hypothetical protein